MQKTTPPGCWIEEVWQIYLCWKHYSNLPQVMRAKFLGSSRLRKLKIYSSGTNKKVISMNYDSSTSCWKPWRWVRLDLIFSMRDIYIISSLNPLTKFTSISISTELKDILLWTISQMITKTILISTRIVISYVNKWCIPFWIWWKLIGN